MSEMIEWGKDNWHVLVPWTLAAWFLVKSFFLRAALGLKRKEFDELTVKYRTETHSLHCEVDKMKSSRPQPAAPPQQPKPESLLVLEAYNAQVLELTEKFDDPAPVLKEYNDGFQKLMARYDVKANCKPTIQDVLPPKLQESRQ